MRILILLLILLSASSTASAECFFRVGSDTVSASIALPATLSIPRNAASGTPLWDSGWQGFGGDLRIGCQPSDLVRGFNAAGMGLPVPGHVSNGYLSVYATNVPGIGVSVYWCDMGQLICPTDPGQTTPLRGLNHPFGDAPWDFWGTLVRPHWRVRLVKTGDIDASAGAVTVGGQSEIGYGSVNVATLSLTGSTQITGLGCELRSDSLNIDVSLPTVFTSDFHYLLPVPSNTARARAFSIGVVCDAGIKVNYQVDGPRDNAASDVLANASGAGMATGVGVQLYKGGLSSTEVLPLGAKVFVRETSNGNESVRMVLTAKYYRTALDNAFISPGLISTTATFTMIYE